MNKKFLSAILFGALMVTSTGTFVSCKDYDDDIDEINKELTEIKSQIAALESAVNNGDYVTGVTPTADGKGMIFTFSKGSPVTVTLNVKDGEPGESAQKITFDEKTGEMLVDNKPTGIFPAKDAEKAPVKIEEGYWAVLNDKGEYDVTEIPVSGVTAVVTDGICTLTVFNADGTTTVVELPTTSSTITELEVVGYLDAKGDFTAFSDAASHDNKYEMGYSAFYTATKAPWEWVDADESQKVKGEIAAETGVVSLAGQSLVIRVAPASADLSTVAMSLVNSKMDEAPITLGTPEAFKGLVTRAASANGLWAIPLSSKELTGLNALTDLTGKFGGEIEDDEFNIAFAVKTPNFLSNFNLAFNKVELDAVSASLNKKKLVEATQKGSTNIYESTSGTEDNAYVIVKQGTPNTFTFDVPTSVYKSQIIVDEYIAQNWGVVIDGNSFTVNKYNDKQTIPSFPVYFNYIQLTETGIKSVTQTVWVRMERTIKDQVVLDPVNHIIPAKAADDKFTVSLDKMFNEMTAEERVNWNKFAHDIVTVIKQVNPDGDDITVTGFDDDNIAYLTADNKPATSALNIAKLQFIPNHEWNQETYPFDKEYYIVSDFEDENGDVLSSVKIPLTVGIPALSTLLQKEQVVFGGTNNGTGVLNEMDYASDNNAVFYSLKYAFKNQLKDAFENENTVKFIIDPQQKIEGNPVVDLAHMGTGGKRTGVNQAIVLDDKEKAYNTPINILIDGETTKYVGKYTWSDKEIKDNAFTIKIVSPIEQGIVEAASGDIIEVVATEDGTAKLTDADLTTKTYAKVEYNIFKDKFKDNETTADLWTSPYMKGISFKSMNENTIKAIANEDIKPATKVKDTVTPGYVVLRPMNVAYEGTTEVEVKVTDVWGYAKTATVKVKVLAEKE